MHMNSCSTSISNETGNFVDLSLRFHPRALSSLIGVTSSSDLLHGVAYHTSKLGPVHVHMYDGKIKATTSNSSQPARKIHCQCPSGHRNVITMKVDAKLHTPHIIKCPFASCFVWSVSTIYY